MTAKATEINDIEPYLRRFVNQADAGKSLANFTYSGIYRSLRTKAAFGMGARSRVPWFGFFANDLVRPSEGAYPVILYYRNAKILVVSYGIGELSNSTNPWGNIEARPISEVLNEKYKYNPERYGSSLSEKTFSTEQNINFHDVSCAANIVIDKYIDILRNHTESAP
jgi:5-methylcytosine-specific restriction protein B